MQTYQHPLTFQDGKEYFYWLKGEIAPACVTFLAYDPCPAFIIVRLEEKRLRCSREDLFLISIGNI